jgi:hypothetical protein
MDNYVIGLYDDREHIFNQNIATRYKELTEFFIRHMGKGKDSSKYLVDRTINGVLDKALEKGYDYCVVMAVGHFLQEPRFFEYIEAWISKLDFFVTGHIIDKQSNNSQADSDGNYWGLHNQCMVINLKYYKQFGQPNFGSKDTSTMVEVAKARRSLHDVHDDYTPIFLAPTEETQVCTTYVDGWNFINVSLENNLTVYNFHSKIRNTKRYTYPKKSIEELKTQLTWINNILSAATDCVFFWNTENYTDTTKAELKPIKRFYSVAAGFKPNFILNKYGFFKDTEILYFDYSKQALAFKRMLVEHWDGEDYPAFLRWAKKKYKINETFGASTERKSYEDLWELELENWGSADNLKAHWTDYKKLKHHFIYCDILKNPEKVTNCVNGTEDSVIWWSNAFHTVTAHYTQSLAELTNHYNNNWIKALQEKNPTLTVFGADHLNNRIRGQSINEL